METHFDDALMRSELQYAGFRAAFHFTLNQLQQQHGGGAQQETRSAGADPSSCGFLDHLPLLKGTAAQIQLECLLTGWNRLLDRQPLQVIDQCVISAAMQQLEDLALRDDQRMLEIIWDGPKQIVTPRDLWLVSKIRSLQLMERPVSQRHLRKLRSPGRLADSPLVQMPQGIEGRGHPDQQTEEILQFVGRWKMKRAALGYGESLLTSDEAGVLKAFCDDHPNLFE